MGWRRLVAIIVARIVAETQKKPRSGRGLRHTGCRISEPSSQPRASADAKTSDEG
jgi:hypothetical protein